LRGDAATDCCELSSQLTFLFPRKALLTGFSGLLFVILRLSGVHPGFVRGSSAFGLAQIWPNAARRRLDNLN